MVFTQWLHFKWKDFLGQFILYITVIQIMLKFDKGDYALILIEVMVPDRPEK